jgi:branched-chain amino acid transport system permease protein
MAVQAEREPPSPLEALLSRPRPSLLSTIGLFLLALVVAILVVNLVQDPQRFATVSVIGVRNGAIYALIALGYTLVYGILQLINFAHGDVFALSGLFASTWIVSILNLDTGTAALGIVGGLALILLVVMLFGAIVNATIEFVAYRRLRNAPRLSALITALGMSFIVQNVSLAIYEERAIDVPDLIPRSVAFSVGGVSAQWDKIAVVLITIPVLIGLTWLVRSTRQGKAMRATAQDPDAAAMMGVDVNRTISFTFLLAGALAGAGGLLFLLEFNMKFDTGFELGLIAFTAAVLGGIGNLTGAVLGGLIIGLIQAYNEGLGWAVLQSDWTRSLVFGILIAILVFRPEGILGERTPEGA